MQVANNNVPMVEQKSKWSMEYWIPNPPLRYMVIGGVFGVTWVISGSLGMAQSIIKPIAATMLAGKIFGEAACIAKDTGNKLTRAADNIENQASNLITSSSKKISQVEKRVVKTINETEEKIVEVIHKAEELGGKAEQTLKRLDDAITVTGKETAEKAKRSFSTIHSAMAAGFLIGAGIITSIAADYLCEKGISIPCVSSTSISTLSFLGSAVCIGNVIYQSLKV